MKIAPLLLIGYNRPEKLEKRLKEIADLSIERIYISIDGSTPPICKEMKKILAKAPQQLRSNINLIVKQHEDNLGLVKHLTSTINSIFKDENNLLVLEDDVGITNNFSDNLQWGLNYLKEKNLNGIVSSYSPLGGKFRFGNYNCFKESIYFSCWGWACSKQTWNKFDINISEDQLEALPRKSTAWKKLNKHQKKVWLGRFNKVRVNPEYTWDYQMQFTSFIHDFTNLIPVQRFSFNEGFSDQRAHHTKGKQPKWNETNILNKNHIRSVIKNHQLRSTLQFLDSLTIAGDRNFPVKIKKK